MGMWVVFSRAASRVDPGGISKSTSGNVTFLMEVVAQSGRRSDRRRMSRCLFSM